MTATTITFAVQLGSDGFAVARAVAERLGYHYLDWEVTSRAAAEAGVSPDVVAASEQNRSTLQRIVQSLMASSSLVSEEVTLYAGPSATEMSSAIGALNTGAYRYFVEDVVRQLADRGEAVIVGHAGQVILQGDPHVLKVLVCGSVHRRAERVAAESGTKVDAAVSTVLNSDKERKAFFKRTYGVDLLDPLLYDMTVNTDRLSMDAVIQNIVACAQSIAGVQKEEVALETAAETTPAAAQPEVEAGEVPPTRQRDALLRAGESLETAMEASAKDTKAWAGIVLNALVALRRVFQRHVRESEVRGGSLAEVLRVKPYLARRVARIREDHARIQDEIADFVTELNGQIAAGDIAVEALREHIVRLQVSLRLHQARGSDLLHEAYMRDDGGE